MNRILVSVFDNEENAFKGQSALKDLHLNGDISLYASAVVSKNENGIAEMKSLSDKGPIGYRVGFVSGAFIGLLGGPIGLALGASIGTLGGLLYDSVNKSFDGDIIDEIARELENGKTAIVAEIGEGWTTPVDTRMSELNAMVFRLNLSEKREEQIKREWETTQTELEELKAELEDASEEARVGIEKQIETAGMKLGTIKDLAEKELDKFISTTEAKVEELEKQMETAGTRAKKKLDKRLKEAQTSLESGKKMFEDTVNKFSKEFEAL